MIHSSSTLFDVALGQKFINARNNYYMDDLTLARGVRMSKQPPGAIEKVQLEVG
jgi:hypothetical protein